MTDFSDPAQFEGQVSLDNMLIYSDIPDDSDASHAIPSGANQNFAFGPHEGQLEDTQNGIIEYEGFPSHYVPHTTEEELYARQAAHHAFLAEQQYLQENGQQLQDHNFAATQFSPDMASAAPSTMNEFFQLMSQPEHVQAYMHFLQKQHEQQQQTQNTSAQPRNRSNSQPPIPTVTTSFAHRPASTEISIDGNSREKKLAKYRTKRARRLTSSQPSSADSLAPSSASGSRDPAIGDHFMPTPKIAKTLTRDLEQRLSNAQEEAKILRSALESREAELQLLRQVVYEEQQFQQWAMQFGEATSSNASSSATSPRPRSPSSTLVSSPSNNSICSSAMDTDYTTSMDASSIGSDHHMLEVLAQSQRRQEKLKQLGGPPSDVYPPWWNGTPLNHPAFQQKEDWQSFELRPQERLARERLNYFLMMQRYRLEQSELVQPHPSMVPPHVDSGDHSVSEDPSAPGTPTTPQSTHPYTHQPASFYQSPHQSHIQPGSPVQGAGYWSGHFAPSTTEKIDFSKISLRKTSNDGRPHPPATWVHTHITTPQNHPSPNSTSTSTTASPQPKSPNGLPGSVAGLGPRTLPPHFQSSPTAAIWREAMAHPEMHRLPTHLGWMQSQDELLARSPQAPPRLPFRRQANPTHSSLSPHP